MDSTNQHDKKQADWIGQMLLAIFPIAILIGVFIFLVAFLINR